MSPARVIAAAFVLLAAGFACGTLTASNGALGGEDAGGDAAPICAPMLCGGEGGACGSVSSCGRTIECGGCASPYTCSAGSCQCASPASCESLHATCGAFADPCHPDAAGCGECSDGSTCQAI